MVRSTADTAMRERLLAAAMEVFAARGYHGAGVEDIVAASGASKGAFYHYFESKQAIFLTLMERLADLVEASVEGAIAAEEGGGALRKVEAALRTVLETVGQHRQLAKILLVEAVAVGPAFEQKRLEIHRRFARLIQRHLDRAVSEGSIPPQDTALAAQAWMGALAEIVSQWLLDGTEPLEPRLPALRALLLRSIGAPVGPGALAQRTTAGAGEA